jgi:hypothetical protein
MGFCKALGWMENILRMNDEETAAPVTEFWRLRFLNVQQL